MFEYLALLSRLCPFVSASRISVPASIIEQPRSPSDDFRCVETTRAGSRLILLSLRLSIDLACTFHLAFQTRKQRIDEPF